MKNKKLKRYVNKMTNIVIYNIDLLISHVIAILGVFNVVTILSKPEFQTTYYIKNYLKMPGVDPGITRL